MTFPNAQNLPAGAIPVYVTSGGQTPAQLTPLGYQQITSLASATSLTVPTGATMAFIAIEGGEARYRDDGVAPTTSVGMPIYAGQSLQYSGSLSALQLIQVSTTVTANVSYYK